MSCGIVPCRELPELEDGSHVVYARLRPVAAGNDERLVRPEVSHVRHVLGGENLARQDLHQEMAVRTRGQRHTPGCPALVDFSHQPSSTVINCPPLRTGMTPTGQHSLRVDRVKGRLTPKSVFVFVVRCVYRLETLLRRLDGYPSRPHVVPGYGHHVYKS